MGDWIVRLVERLGYPGVALLMFLENVFPPIPSELIMPLAGYHTVKGDLDLVGVLIAGSSGSLLGALGWYLIGRMVGEQRLRTWVRRHGRWLTVSEADLDRAQDWFSRHGGWAVMVGRLVPGVRTFISLPAGLARMHPVPFLAYSAVGTVVWTAALAWAGRLLAARFGEVEKVLGPASWVILGAVLGLYAYRLIRGHGKTSAASA